MTRTRLVTGLLAVSLMAVVAWPVLAASLEDARLLQAPDGVLFVVADGVRYRVTPRLATDAELGAIPEGPSLAVGLLAPEPVAASPSPPAGPRIIVPSANIGLVRETPIPLGATCSCTIDRAGQISQFDITVIRVQRDAFPLLQQANRFNKPPAEGYTYVGVLVDMKYIRGPEQQAYTVAPSDFRAAPSSNKLSDPASVINPGPILEADLRPGATLTGWVFFELPANEPASMLWTYSFFGERGVWFALQ